MDSAVTLDEPVIFFDGVCNLCNFSVNFIIDRDPKERFKLAALQSKLAEDVLPGHGVDPNELESIVLYKDGRVFTRSRAALEIARGLNGAWPMLYALVIIPGVLRDLIYNWIARNRYRWFGKQDHCRMPTPALKSRFADS